MKRLLFIALSLCSMPVMAMWQQPISRFKVMQQQQINYNHKVIERRDKFIDGLQAHNKTVRNFVKEQHKQKNDEAIKGIQKASGLPDSYIEGVEGLTKEIKAASQGAPDCRVVVLDKNEKINETASVPIIVKDFYKEFYIKLPLGIWHNETLSSGTMQQLPFVEGKYIPVNLLIWGSDMPCFKECIPGFLAHEFTHLKKYHPLKLTMIYRFLEFKEITPSACPAFQRLSHSYEFEADQLYATTNVANARIMENFTKVVLSQNINVEGTATHPATAIRHKAVKEIRKMMEAQDRWYAGPKGYKKYGKPAFERMWDRRCENQKS